MKKRMITRTMQRGFLYLTLIVVIVLLIVLWPIADTPVDSAAGDSTSSALVDEEPTARHDDNLSHKQTTARHDDRPTPRKNDRADLRLPADSSHRTSDADRQRMYRPQNTPSPKRQIMVEVNSADTVTLQLINGIGPAYARRIVRYRERLGGFHCKEQLLEVYGFTPELLQYIEHQITIDSATLKKININTIGVKQLSRHPYIDPYQARDIVVYRNRGHRFNSIDDLRLIGLLDDSTITKIRPYLSFDTATVENSTSNTSTAQ